jgi:hypothetical protein
LKPWPNWDGITFGVPAKLRFETILNKKTLKQAWRFFLLK